MAVDITAEDLDPQAGVQYVACDLLEKANAAGYIYGRFPRKLLDYKERELLRRLLRDKSGTHKYSDVEVEGAIRWAIASLVSQGWNFECDISKMMGWYKGE